MTRKCNLEVVIRLYYYMGVGGYGAWLVWECAGCSVVLKLQHSEQYHEITISSMEGRRPVVVTWINIKCILVGQRNITHSAIFLIFFKRIVTSEHLELHEFIVTI